MSFQQYSEQIPESIKVTTAVGAPVLHLFGLPIEQWGFVLSAVVSILFIVEKVPMLIRRIKEMRDWLKKKSD